MKVRIVSVSKQDAFYEDRDVLVGLEGEWKGVLQDNGEFVGGMFYLSDESKKLPRVISYSDLYNDKNVVEFFYLYKTALEEIR